MVGQCTQGHANELLNYILHTDLSLPDYDLFLGHFLEEFELGGIFEFSHEGILCLGDLCLGDL
jgi:hypothetical protein